METSSTLGVIKTQVIGLRNRHPGKHLPLGMKQKITNLLGTHTIGHIAKTLDIPGNTLRRWKGELEGEKKGKDKPKFVRKANVAQIAVTAKKNSYELEIEQGASKTLLWFENADLVAVFFRSLTENNPITAINLRSSEVFKLQ